MNTVESVPPPSERTPERFTPPAPLPLIVSVVALDAGPMAVVTFRPCALLLPQVWFPLNRTVPLPLNVDKEFDVGATVMPPLPTVKA